MRGWLALLIAAAVASALGNPLRAATLGDDLAFLRAHTEVVELSEPGGSARVVVSPALQGRVLTSAEQPSGLSLGWVNRDLIASGKRADHINVYGGEDRLWLGPEGGQFGLYFAPGVPFDLEHWYVPKPFDVLPFKLEHRQPDRVRLTTAFDLANYSGTHFSVRIERTVRVLPAAAAWKGLGIDPLAGVSMVAYESNNTLVNTGLQAWHKESGLLSIWILGMFPPSEHTTIVVPLRPVTASGHAPGVKSDYFGPIPPDRFALQERAVFLSADGRFRSKMGVAASRALGRVGSYDAEHHILTIVQSNQPADVTEYVNSAWQLQDNPYAGDPINAYNDGPASPGARPLGPFYELETSSPAASLAPGARIEHTHRTLHLIGTDAALDPVARQLLGVSLAEIQIAAHGGVTPR